jgi:hypothetical protein
VNPSACHTAAPASSSVHLAGSPAEIGGLWGRLNRAPITHDLEAFFLKPARGLGLSEADLVRQAERFVTIAAEIAPHWLSEAAAIAAAAGVGADLYVAFMAGVYRNLFRHPECTSYAVSAERTGDGAILFHKNRDNVDKAQSAFVLSQGVKGTNRFIATSDASVLACMMMVNDKGLAGSADYPGGITPAKAPARYRGLMNPLLLRHIAERAEDCASALALIEECVGRGDYAGGEVNETHWLFVDRSGEILEVSNNTRHVVSRRHRGKVYFSRLDDSPAACRLREADRPVDFGLFHGVSRDPSICLASSIAGMTVEIDAERPELLTCAWVALPAHSVSFPLLMGQQGTPRCLADGEAYRLGQAAGERRALWEGIENGIHASKSLLRDCVRQRGTAPGGAPQATESIEGWAEAQAEMILGVLHALQGS